MEVVWAADEPLRTRIVVRRLNEERELAYTTVQTVMEILYRKGWLDRTREGRAYRYWARQSREDYVAALMADALEVTEDRGAAFARFFERMDPADKDDLRKAFEAARSAEADA